MHSSRMRTGRFSDSGGLPTDTDPPGHRSPDKDSPGRNMGPGTETP